MYKIFLTCRNRLSITGKAITAIRKFSKLPHQIYVYDNCTNHKIDEHFMYWNLLLQKKIIHQVTFNTTESTFNAFSKAVSFNNFLFNNSQDPNINNCEFLVCMDNDIIVVKDGWDIILRNSWNDIKNNKLDYIKVIGQLPGGIKSKSELNFKIGGQKAKIGKFGGSGFWSMRNNFHSDVGYLDLKELVGLNKKHDQNYWKKMDQINNGKEYILGLDCKLVVHTGSIVGSICNTLSRNKNLKSNKLDELIKFEKAEEEINNIKFDDFYNNIINNKSMMNDW